MGTGRADPLDAAAEVALELLAQRGPGPLTLPEVAERAGVPEDVLRARFATEQDLIRAALTRSATLGHPLLVEATRRGASMAELAELPEARRHISAVARCIVELADEDPQEIFPTARDFVRAGVEHGLDPVDAKARTVLLLATACGMQLYADWFATAAGLEDGDRSRVTELLDVALSAVDDAMGVPPWPWVWVDG